MIAVSNPPVPPAPAMPRVATKPPSVTSPVNYAWTVNGSRLTLKQLVVRNPPPGAVATLTCRGKRCPLKSVSARNVAKARIDVLKALGKKRRFRAGQTLELKVSAPGYNSKLLRFTPKAKKLPTGVPYCVPLGATKPQRSC